MLFGDEVINSPRLTVPHYDMKNRGFMLWPLFEIALSCVSLTARRCATCWPISARKTRQLVIPFIF
jgi:7,8-dihydro-6-hydroxymethylpterin-pyrophosphokinase